MLDLSAEKVTGKEIIIQIEKFYAEKKKTVVMLGNTIKHYEPEKTSLSLLLGFHTILG